MLLILFSLVPSAPVVKDITAIDSHSVHIQWYMPTNTNGILSTYTIYYTIDGGSEISVTVAFNGYNVSCKCTIHDNTMAKYYQYVYLMQAQYYDITGLSPYQLITVTITATNGAGTSEPSNEVSGRTNEAGMMSYNF